MTLYKCPLAMGETVGKSGGFKMGFSLWVIFPVYRRVTTPSIRLTAVLPA